ncbi:MAG: response regulator [Desulfomicrobium apsheronum]|nr:response regulator [Desulfomicrobium apsheronum]
MKFLIVEDDPAGAMLLRMILTEYGDVDEVNDGPGAIEAFDGAWSEGRPYDVIFLDIMMPDMNGHEVLKIIRERERALRLPQIREVKVIMTTALDSAESVSQAFYEGRASGYLVKPIYGHSIINEMKKLGII